MASSARAQRTLSRSVHIVVGLVLGTIVYAPEYVSQPLLPFAQFVAVPAAVITGVFLWQQGRIRSALKRRTGGGAAGR